MLIFAIVVSLSFNLRADTCDWVDETVSDSLWIQWFLPKYDNNVEIIEMRNEYLFGRLVSTESCSFLRFLSNSIEDVTRSKIGKELQNPIHDDININTCVQNILSCPSIHSSFKIWLIDNIKRPKGNQPQYPFQSMDPIANFAWNENDTTRYEGHYRFENAYRMIEEMLTDKRPLDFAEAVFAVENCMYDGKLDRSAYLAELNRIATGVKNMATSGEIKYGADVNRGMPLSILGGKIGTARDVGNIAAGYLSGVHGMPFSITRLAFDALQKGIEPPVSRSAQNIGYFTGYYNFLMLSNPYGVK